MPIGNTCGNVTYEPHDGPGQGLEIRNLKAMYIGDGTPEVVPETYLMYAMFRPNLSAAIWVPIKVLKWGWEGCTEYTSMELGHLLKREKSPHQFLLTHLISLNGIGTQMTATGCHTAGK